jgi:hypothetical protein
MAANDLALQKRQVICEAASLRRRAPSDAVQAAPRLQSLAQLIGRSDRPARITRPDRVVADPAAATTEKKCTVATVVAPSGHSKRPAAQKTRIARRVGSPVVRCVIECPKVDGRDSRKVADLQEEVRIDQLQRHGTFSVVIACRRGS